MAKSLTVKALENLKPGDARKEVPDGLIRGLFFVLQPTGKASWAVRYRSSGQTRKLTLGTYPAIDLKSARELASRALVKVAGGDDPAAEKQAAKKADKAPVDRDLVEKVVETFIERYAKANTRSWGETERMLNKEVVGAWRGRHFSEIGKADVHELLDKIVDRGSPIAANRILAALRRMCAWAVERDIVKSSPCEGVKSPSVARSRDRVLNDEELSAIWKAAVSIGWPFGPLVQLLILTGQRRDEVAEMRWNEIDLDAKTWTLPRARAKNDVEHVVPLSNAALGVLKALPRVSSKAGYVFTTNGTTPVSGFARAKLRLDQELARTMPGMPAWVIHDLRRTFASGAARLGINLPVIEKVLNHVSGSFRGIVGVYQRHSFADEKRAALETWGRFVATLVSGEVAGNVLPLKAWS
ncbi:Integrase [Methylocella tundrae]|uniref:Integrase n=1 Tax=Methylocella tundrae TaxID=227605 RepID=A0A8B6MD63_METTU|nr:site-specific integrase [Methylocella tundrae]VTZ52196.1 Integrase [Methylocella tundrae]